MDRGPRARPDGDVPRGGRIAGRLEQRRVDDPHERPGVGVDHVQAPGDLPTGGAQQCPRRLDRTGREEHAVPGFGADVGSQAVAFGIGEILGHRTGQFAVLADQHIGQSFGPALLGPLLPAIEGPARLRGAARHHHRPDIGRLEHPERGVCEVLGALDQFQPEAQIRLVRTESAHRVGVGHPRDGARHVIADQGPQ